MSDTKQKSIGAILKADPYADKNPFAIKGPLPPDEHFPEGQVLRWVSLDYRNRRGLRGHILMQWDDPYIKGKTQEETRANLAKYVLDPPDKYAHSTSNFIERGDVCLARIDRAIFDSRQLQRRLKSDGNLRKAAAAEKGNLTGDGLADDTPTRRQIMPHN